MWSIKQRPTVNTPGKKKKKKPVRMAKLLSGSEDMLNYKRCWASHQYLFTHFPMRSEATNRLGESQHNCVADIGQIPPETWIKVSWEG